MNVRSLVDMEGVTKRFMLRKISNDYWNIFKIPFNLHFAETGVVVRSLHINDFYNREQLILLIFRITSSSECSIT